MFQRAFACRADRGHGNEIDGGAAEIRPRHGPVGQPAHDRLQPVVGEAPELRNYFVAAGLNSIGILTGGGLGRALAHWIVDGRPDIDVTGFNIDRLHRYQNTPEYRAARTVEALGTVYKCHYPNRPMQTARGAKLSPLHHRLVERRAYFRDVSGWEMPDWYAPAGAPPTVDALTPT